MDVTYGVTYVLSSSQSLLLGTYEVEGEVTYVIVALEKDHGII